MRDEQYCVGVLKELARSTKVDMGPIMLKVYMQALSKYSWEKVADALESCFMDLKRFPTVVDIESKMGVKQPDQADEANEIVGRLIFAIGRFGGYKASEARSHIGEIGWEVVERNGGWELICNLEEEQLNTFRAQMRDQIKAVAAMASVGRLAEPKNFEKLPEEVQKLLDGTR